MAPQHSEPHSTSTACDPPTNDAANGNEDQSNATRRPPNWIPVYEAPLFTRRKLKVVCVGAGFSGLILAQKIRYQYQLADAVDLVIYEKNEEVGGTWWENRYPGIACDLPAHTYVFPFEPNPDWTSYYVSGAEIQSYIARTTRKWKLDENIRFNAKVVSATWNDESGKWDLVVEERVKTGNAAISSSSSSSSPPTIKNESCDILINASGYLNRWKLPTNIPGLEDFKGKLVHSAAWDESYAWQGKKVAVIGNGSSGIQVVSAMADGAAKLVNYVRTPTWVSTNILGWHAEGGKNFDYSEEQKKIWREDPAKFLEYRTMLENSVNGYFHALIVGSPLSEGLTAACRKLMEERLEFSPELAKKLIPTFHPGCRRLTPGDAYLEKFKLPHVSMSFSPLSRFTAQGIITKDAETHAEQEEEPFDLIVCATGFHTTWIPSFALTGLHGTTLEQKGWETTPKAFFSVQVDGFPNFFIFNGPNCPLTHGNLITSIAFEADYMIRWMGKMAREDIKSVDVKEQSLEDYNVYTQEVMQRTVWADPCRSWYKNGRDEGWITAPYGGSFAHFKAMLENVGGEHFNVTYRSKNRFRFLGNGQALGEIDEAGNGNFAPYMDEYESLRQKMEAML